MLTETTIKSAKPAAKPYKLSDERGMYLLVTPAGARSFRLKYYMQGKERLLTLGMWPDVSLKRAREKRDEARKLVADGIDPGALKKAAKAATANTFEIIAREWHAKQCAVWDAGHAQTIMRRLETGLFPWIGPKDVASIEPPELLEVLRKTESTGRIETAHRLLQASSKIFRYAIQTGRAKRDPAADIRGALAPIKWEKRSAILVPVRIGELLRAIDGYVGQPATHAALKLLPHVFLRSKELRYGEWSEIDFDSAQWNIPGPRMKLAQGHIVPLSRQSLQILRELHSITGRGALIFPSLTNSGRPISENTLNACLRRLGYSGDQMTSHGFRSVAATLLNEHGWSADAVERQLAHAPQNQVRASYVRSEFLAERRRMMQQWSDYLDQLRSGTTNVVAINHRSIIKRGTAESDVNS